MDMLRHVFSHNPAIRLLRHPHVLFLFSFLTKVFKEYQLIMVNSDVLQGYLTQYLEDPTFLPDELPNVQGSLEKRAKLLLNYWCSDEVRFLRRFADEEGQLWVELTPWTEKALQWISQLEEIWVVGTESRFEEILQRMDELIDHMEEDPTVAIRRLEDKKALLDEQIHQIRQTGIVSSWNEQQVNERVITLNRLSRELLGDFKQVEQNFKHIVQEIYHRQIQKDFSKGEVLGYAMDATEQLRNSPQGRSFYAFWGHLVQDTSGETLQERVEELHKRLDKKGIPLCDTVLRHLKNHLHLAGRKVIAGNHLLAEKLNKLLNERKYHHRERVLFLLQDVRKIMMRWKPTSLKDRVFCTIEGDCELSMVMDRPFSEFRRETVLVAQPQKASQEIQEVDLDALRSQFYLDTALLKARVRDSLKQHGRTDLSTVLASYPLKKGLSELVAYLELASYSFSSKIHPDVLSELTLDERRMVKLPSVEFLYEG